MVGRFGSMSIRCRFDGVGRIGSRTKDEVVLNNYVPPRRNQW
jgi:hypothetical protein